MAKTTTIHSSRYQNRKVIAGACELEFDGNGDCTCDSELAERLSKMKGFSTPEKDVEKAKPNRKPGRPKAKRNESKEDTTGENEQPAAQEEFK